METVLPDTRTRRPAIEVYEMPDVICLTFEAPYGTTTKNIEAVFGRHFVTISFHGEQPWSRYVALSVEVDHASSEVCINGGTVMAIVRKRVFGGLKRVYFLSEDVR